MYSKRLRDVPMFERLGNRDIETLSQLADEVDIQAGKVLTREGDWGREFFVIESGTAEVTRGGEPVAELGPGEFFGEMALVEDELRTATVTARSDMTLIVLAAREFRSLKRSMPDVYKTICEEIVKRRAAAV